MQTPQRHPKTLRFRQQKRLMARRPRSQAWRQYKKYQTVRKHEYGTRIAIVLHSTCLANLEDMTGSKGDPMARCTSLKGLQTLALPLQLDFGANSTRLPCTPDFQLISTWSISLAWSLGQFFMEPLVPPSMPAAWGGPFGGHPCHRPSAAIGADSHVLSRPKDLCNISSKKYNVPWVELTMKAQ